MGRKYPPNKHIIKSQETKKCCLGSSILTNIGANINADLFDQVSTSSILYGITVYYYYVKVLEFPHPEY